MENDNLNFGEDFPTFDPLDTTEDNVEEINIDENKKKPSSKPIKTADNNNDEKESKKSSSVKTVIDAGTEFENIQNPEDEEEPNYLKEEDEENYEELNDNEPNDFDQEEVIRNYEIGLELGIFVKPEDENFEFDGSEESIQKVLDTTKEHNMEQARLELENAIGDPLLWEIIQHGIEGKSFADIQGKIKRIEERESYKNYDVSNEEDSLKLYKEMLNDQGVTKRVIDSTLRSIEDNGDFEDAGKEALEYFENKIQEQDKLQTEQEKELAKENDRKTREYRNNFMSTLDELKLSKSERERVLASFEQTKVGEQNLTDWQARIVQVQQNPEHFIEMLQLLQSYDPKNGFSFDKQKRQGKTQSNRSLASTLSKPRRGKSSSSNTRNSGGARRNPIDRNIQVI